MTLPLLTLPLRSKRDVLTARQRVRQIAGLLGYDPQARLAIPARAFEIACRAFRQRGRGTVVVQIEDDTLQVFVTNQPRPTPEDVRPKARTTPPAERACVAMNAHGVERLLTCLFRTPAATVAGSLRLEVALPRPILDRQDVAWAVRELGRQTPLDVFEEIRQQNQDVLALLPELPKPAGAERRHAA